MFERGTRSGCSAARLARQLRELEVPGSNPGTPTKFKFAYLKHRALASRARAFLFLVFVPAGGGWAGTFPLSKCLKESDVCGMPAGR